MDESLETCHVMRLATMKMEVGIMMHGGNVNQKNIEIQMLIF